MGNEENINHIVKQQQKKQHIYKWIHILSDN